jgi:hypothetical protein
LVLHGEKGMGIREGLDAKKMTIRLVIGKHKKEIGRCVWKRVR